MKTLVWLVALWLGMPATGFSAPAESEEPNLRQVLTESFPRWDRNRDGILDGSEINAMVGNPVTRGNESAAIVLLWHRYCPDEDQRTNLKLPKSMVLSLGDNPDAQHEFASNLRRLKTLRREIFLGSDPNLGTFHQGTMGDCYLLCVVGGLVYRDPQSIRNMLHLQPNGSIMVNFPGGKTVVVPFITESEVFLGALTGRDHGVWLSIIEKAYGQVVKQKPSKQTSFSATPDNAVTRDVIGRGGSPIPVIQTFTGHQAGSLRLSANTREKTQTLSAEVHDLVLQSLSARRLMAAGTPPIGQRTLPREIAPAHMYAVLGYDPSRRLLRLFNPWGNDFTPAGPPGLVNGYLTRHGQFDMPVADFVQTFSALCYETGNPLSARE